MRTQEARPERVEAKERKKECGMKRSKGSEKNVGCIIETEVSLRSRVKERMTGVVGERDKQVRTRTAQGQRGRRGIDDTQSYGKYAKIRPARRDAHQATLFPTTRLGTVRVSSNHGAIILTELWVCARG